MPMDSKIGLEASYAFMGRGGIDRYAYELFHALLARDGSECYRLFTLFAPFRFDDLSGAPFKSPASRKLAMAQVEATRRLWSWTARPTVEQLVGPVDLVHVVHHFAPPVERARLIVTIHDLSFEYPEYGIEHAELYSRDARRAVQHADCVIAVSEFTKIELQRLYDVPEDRIRVVHEGVRVAHWNESSIAEVQDQRPYFLVVGKVEARKNLIRLARGFTLARERYGLPHRLVIVGKRGRGGKAILGALRDSEACQHVVYRQFVSDLELRRLYRNATAFVYPSLYEGFGLPALEAMAAGTPVVASAAASLPEVIGRAGLLVEEGTTEAWADAMWRIADDSDLRRTLTAAGAERVRDFTWASAAADTEAVYREVLGK